MKNKLKASLLAVASAAALATSSAAFAAPATVYEVPDVKIVVDSNKITLSDVPIIVSGRTLLPIRSLSNNLGVPNDDQHIIWNGSESSVTIVKDAKKIYLKVGSTSAKVNDLATSLDCAPINYKSRVYIPVRFVSASFGLKVDWNDKSRTVSIVSNGTSTDPGTNPSTNNALLINPTSAEFDKKAPSDVNISLLSNTAITSITSSSKTLAAGTDYSVNGSSLSIKSAFLGTLSVGDNTLTINYGSGKTDALKVTVKDSDSQNTDSGLNTAGTTVIVDSVTGNKGSTVTIPVRLKSVPSSGLEVVELNIVYDPNIVKIEDVTPGDIATGGDNNFSFNIGSSIITILFTDENVGSELSRELVTKDGIIANIKCTINSSASGSAAFKFSADPPRVADKDLKGYSIIPTDGVLTIN